MRFALLGSPVGHSLSPAMHKAALERIGRVGDYEARDVDVAGLEAAIDELRSGRLTGANVTMPHKQAAYGLTDGATDRARLTRAVNTLALRGERVVGYNTDVDGIVAAWNYRQLPTDAAVVILGSGGAAAAAMVANQSRELHLVARRLDRAAELADQIGLAASVIPWGVAVPAGVIVNATPIGMRGEDLPRAVLERAAGLLDMAYGNVPTPAVARLRAKGIPVADGLDMLVGQAARSFEIWTGAVIAPGVFRVAAEQELLKRSQSGTRVEE